jgi:hypothetical protein
MSARSARLFACVALLMATAATADPIAPLHTKAGGALLGKSATVRGVVTGVYSTAKVTRLYVQDATGGLCLYGSPVTCAALGDSIEATGTVASYSGLTELSGRSEAPLVVTKLGRASAPPKPALLSITQLNEGEKADGSEPDESRLVTITSVFIRMSDGSAPAEGARFKDDTNYRLLPAGAAGAAGPDTTAAYGVLRVQDAEGCEGLASLDGAAIPSGAVNVTGVISQHADRTTGKGGYQVLPRTPADLVAASAAAKSAATKSTPIKSAGH